MVLLSAFRTGVSRSALDCGAFGAHASITIGALIAFRPAFTISVAKIAFSFAESNSCASVSFKAVPREAGRDGGRAVFPTFVCVAIRPLAALFSALPSNPSYFAALFDKSSLRVDTVVGEHVVAEVMALFTDSMFAL